MSEIEYRIKSGDTLSAIARRHGVTVDAIARLNGISDVNRIWAGHVVRIPKAGPSKPRAAQSPASYRVRAGDTLSEIAQRYNVTVDALVKTNGIKNPDLIGIGLVLKIPPPQGPVQDKPKKETASQSQGKETAFQGRGTEDLIKKARKLSAEYLTLRHLYLEWTANKERASKYCIALWTQALVEQDPEAYGSRVAQTRLDDFLKYYTDEECRRRDAYEAKGGELVDHLLLPAFNHQYDALADQKRVECYADVTEGLSECAAGRKFILEELKAAEKNDPTSRLVDLFKVLKEANNVLWMVLGEFAPVIVKWKQEQALAYVEQIIVQRFKIVTVNQLRKTVTLYSTAILTVQYQPITVTLLSLEHVRVSDTTTYKVTNKLMQRAFEALNFGIALNDAMKQPDLKTTVALVGALAGVLEQLTVVTRALTTKNLLRAAGKGMEVSILGIIGGICDTITGSMDTWDYYSKEDYDAAIVAGVGTAGSVLLTAGLSMMYFGAGTAWSGWGLVIAIVGGAIALIAAMVSFFGGFADSPLQLWVENSEFGTKAGEPAPKYKSWKGKYSKQIEELLDLLCSFDVSGRFEGDAYRITVKPSLLLTCSSMYIKATVMVDERMTDYQIVKVDGKKIENNLVKEFSFDLSWPSKLPDSWRERLIEASQELLPDQLLTLGVFPKVRLQLKVDLYGNGVMKYEREIRLNPLLIERLLSIKDDSEKGSKAKIHVSGLSSGREKPLLAMGRVTRVVAVHSPGNSRPRLLNG